MLAAVHVRKCFQLSSKFALAQDFPTHRVPHILEERAFPDWQPLALAGLLLKTQNRHKVTRITSP